MCEHVCSCMYIVLYLPVDKCVDVCMLLNVYTGILMLACLFAFSCVGPRTFLYLGASFLKCALLLVFAC